MPTLRTKPADDASGPCAAGGVLSLTGLLRELRARGILRHPLPVRVYARIAGMADRVRAGEYRLEPGITPRGILAKRLEQAVSEPGDAVLASERSGLGVGRDGEVVVAEGLVDVHGGTFSL